MIKIGQRVRFIPFWNISEHDDEATKREKTVTGRVIYVNLPHKYFTVEYRRGGSTERESFKFSQLGSGKEVRMVGGVRHGR